MDHQRSSPDFITFKLKNSCTAETTTKLQPYYWNPRRHVPAASSFLGGHICKKDRYILNMTDRERESHPKLRIETYGLAGEGDEDQLG